MDTSEATASISNKIMWSLHTLPVELVYQILDNLDPITIIRSCRNVCIRLNAITDTYNLFQVVYSVLLWSFSFLTCPRSLSIKNLQEYS
jgi:hypothetical protein